MFKSLFFLKRVDELKKSCCPPAPPADTFEMVSEDEDGKVMFKVNYHYMSQVKNANDTNSAARSRRLAQEAVTLSTSLPLSSSSSVFVRCDEERLDIMKVNLLGPADRDFTLWLNTCGSHRAPPVRQFTLRWSTFFLDLL